MWKRRMYVLAIGAALANLSVAQLSNNQGTVKSFGRPGDCVQCAQSAQRIAYTAPLTTLPLNQDLTKKLNGFVNSDQVMAGYVPSASQLQNATAPTALQQVQNGYASSGISSSTRAALSAPTFNFPMYDAMFPKQVDGSRLDYLSGALSGPDAWSTYTDALNRGLSSPVLSSKVFSPYGSFYPSDVYTPGWGFKSIVARLVGRWLKSMHGAPPLSPLSLFGPKGCGAPCRISPCDQTTHL